MALGWSSVFGAGTRLLVLLLLVASCRCACGTVASLHIGALVTIPDEERRMNATYDGSFEEESKATIRAYKLWEEHVNAHGGIRIQGTKHLVNVSFINIGSTPESALERASAACSSRPSGLFLGPYSSFLTEPVAIALQQCDSVLVSSGAASRDVFACSSSASSGCTATGQRRFRNLWGVLNLADRSYIDAISLFKLQNAKSIAIFYDESFPWSLSLAHSTRAYAKTAGLEIVYDQVFPKVVRNSSTSLITSYVDDIARTNPDVVVAIFYSSRARAFLRSLRSSRFLPKGLIVRLASDEGPTMADLDLRFIVDIHFFNKALSGEEYTDFQYFPPTANVTSAAAFDAAFVERWGSAPGGNIEAVAFVAGQALHRAIETANSSSPAAIRTAMPSLKFNSIIGTVHFSDLGYNDGLNFITVQRDHANKLKLLAPLPTATSDVIYPLPSWDERAENLTRFSSPMEHGILVATALLIAVSLGCVVFTAMYRRRTVVHQATPSMLVIFLAGSILLYVGVIFWGLNPTDGDCNATIFFVGTGFVAIFGSLFSRTYRIYAISRNKGYRNTRKDVTDLRLLLLVAILIIIEWIPSILWICIAPTRAILVVPDPSRPSLSYRYCRPPEPLGLLFLGIYMLYKILLLLAGLILSARVWNVSRYSVETKQIAFAMYNLLVALSLCGASFLVFNSQREISFLVRTVSILMGVAVTVATVFAPKISAVCSRKKSRGERSHYNVEGQSRASNEANARVRFSAASAESPSADATRTGSRTGTREALMESVGSPPQKPNSEVVQLHTEVAYLRGVVHDLTGRLAAYEPSASAESSSSRASVLQQPSILSSMYSASGPAQSERGSALRKDMFFESVAASQDSQDS